MLLKRWLLTEKTLVEGGKEKRSFLIFGVDISPRHSFISSTTHRLLVLPSSLIFTYATSSSNPNQNSAVQPWGSPTPLDKPLTVPESSSNSKNPSSESKVSSIPASPPSLPSSSTRPRLSDLKPASPRPDSIPTVDLSGCDSGRRPSVVEEVGRAARELGFFQVVNHGVPTEVLDRTITAVKAFNEQPMEVKAKIYRRGFETTVAFFSNVDLFRSKAASWRDTLQIRLEPKPDVQEIPEVCRSEVMEWNQQIQRLGGTLLGLLSEGLGLSPEKLQELTCPESRVMVGNYYPYCSQPDLTVGLASHTDPGVFAVLLQDHLPGLQVKHGDEWLEAPPIPGALEFTSFPTVKIILIKHHMREK